MITVILFVTSCGTKETINNKTEEEGKNIVQQTEEPAQVTETPVHTTETPVQATRNPIQVTENTLIFSCKTNKKNTPGYQNIETVCPDSFYVSDDMILLDDTVNKRILVYEKGEFLKSIELDWNYDILDLFYLKEDHIIKTVYTDYNADTAAYYTLDINMEDGSKTNEEKIGDGEHVLLHFYFREDGKLITDHLHDPANEEHEKLFKKKNKLLSKDFTSTICFKNADENELVLNCSKLYPIGEKLGKQEVILRSESGQFVTFAVPEQYEKRSLSQGFGYIKYINGNIYQLSVSEDKIEIYILAEEDIKKNDIRYLERVVR